MAVRDERMENVDIWILANLTASSKHENLACKMYFVFTRLLFSDEPDLTIKYVTECWKSCILIFTKQEEFYKNVCTPCSRANLWSFQLYVVVVTNTEDIILTMMYRISLTVLV